MDRSKQTNALADIDAPRSSSDADPHRAARHERIARSACSRAEAREFAPGGEVEDWLVAEREIAICGANV